jgi:aldehyde dehydrogenase (NAD+)
MVSLTERSLQEEQIAASFSILKSAVPSLRREPLKNRIARLTKLRQWIHTNRGRIHEAAYADLSKPAVEVDGTELFHVLNEIKLAVDQLENWAEPRKIDAPFTMLGTRSTLHHEPRGVCLIIAPWNYPFSLAVGPLISALAAGNAVIVKPSELTPHISSLLSKMTEEVFEKDTVHTHEGGPEVARYLLSLPFDHIFFTGSPAIGKVVMKAAAENLTSVTLELGGKSPTIISDTANLKDAAKRVAVGKFVNNGQTCIAPDYILIDEKIVSKFIERLIEQIKKLFSENGSFEQSKSYSRIVNERHFNRLNELVQDALQSGAKMEWGGNADQSTRFIHPIVLTQVPEQSRIMMEEIFGPVLPVITYKGLDEAIATINSKPKPLALYLFTASHKVRERILAETSSGAVCVNDCAIHFLHHNLPFGGVNNSGIGKSHGYSGFLAFSNEKPVLKQKSGFTSVSPFYPPYTTTSRKLMDWFLKLF